MRSAFIRNSGHAEPGAGPGTGASVTDGCSCCRCSFNATGSVSLSRRTKSLTNSSKVSISIKSASMPIDFARSIKSLTRYRIFVSERIIQNIPLGKFLGSFSAPSNASIIESSRPL